DSIEHRCPIVWGPRVKTVGVGMELVPVDDNELSDPLDPSGVKRRMEREAIVDDWDDRRSAVCDRPRSGPRDCSQCTEGAFAGLRIEVSVDLSIDTPKLRCRLLEGVPLPCAV